MDSGLVFNDGWPRESRSGSLTANFLDPSPVIAIGGTNEGVTNYLHFGGATNPASYYRVRLEP